MPTLEDSPVTSSFDTEGTRAPTMFTLGTRDTTTGSFTGKYSLCVAMATDKASSAEGGRKSQFRGHLPQGVGYLWLEMVPNGGWPMGVGYTICRQFRLV